jgi:hypothetical protein
MVPLSSTSSPVQVLDVTASSGIVVLVAAHSGGVRRPSQTKAIASPPSVHNRSRIVLLELSN